MSTLSTPELPPIRTLIYKLKVDFNDPAEVAKQKFAQFEEELGKLFPEDTQPQNNSTPSDQPRFWSNLQEGIEETEQGRVVLGLILFAVEALSHINDLRTMGQSEDPSKELFAVVRLVLESEGTQEGRSVDTLARALMPHLVSFWDYAILKQDRITSQEQFTEDGMLWLDARAAQYISLELRDKAFAEKYREKAQEALQEFNSKEKTIESFVSLFRFWLPKHFTSLEAPTYEIDKEDPHDWVNFFLPRYVFAFAHTLWERRVKPQFEKEHASTLPLEITRRVISTYGKRGATISEDGRSLVRENEIIAKIPAMPAEDLEQINQAALALGSLDMARAIPWVVRKAWEQYGQPNDADVIVEGGLTGFGMQVLGASRNNASERATKVLDAGEKFKGDWPGFTSSGLWGYTYTRPARGKKASLCITTMPILRPHSQFARKELGPWLVPILPPPPLVGRQNEHAPQAFFASQLVLALVEHRGELLDGGALIKPAELERLADIVGLPKPTLYSALNHWREDNEDGPAFLEIEGDPARGARYMLADSEPYRSARSFLLDGAELSRDAKQSAKKSLARRKTTIRGKNRRKK